MEEGNKQEAGWPHVRKALTNYEKSADALKKEMEHAVQVSTERTDKILGTTPPDSAEANKTETTS